MKDDANNDDADDPNVQFYMPNTDTDAFQKCIGMQIAETQITTFDERYKRTWMDEHVIGRSEQDGFEWDESQGYDTIWYYVIGSMINETHAESGNLIW